MRVDDARRARPPRARTARRRAPGRCRAGPRSRCRSGPAATSLHLDPGVAQVDGHRLAPPAQRELRRAVRRLVGDAEPAAHARHVHDACRGRARASGGAAPCVMRTGEVKLTRITASTSSRVEARHRRPLRDRGVVHEAVEPAEGVPGLARRPRSAASRSPRSTAHSRDVRRVLGALAPAPPPAGPRGGRRSRRSRRARRASGPARRRCPTTRR